MQLQDYMKQRDALLTARYGDGGKGFLHEWVSPQKRQVPFIEALLPPEPVVREVAQPTVPIKVKPRKAKQTSSRQQQKRVVRAIRKIKREPAVENGISEPKTDELLLESPSFVRQRMGFSFLSHLPTPLATIEQILTKTRPTMSEEALKEHLMQRDSVTTDTKS